MRTTHNSMNKRLRLCSGEEWTSATVFRAGADVSDCVPGRYGHFRLCSEQVRAFPTVFRAGADVSDFVPGSCERLQQWSGFPTLFRTGADSSNCVSDRRGCPQKSAGIHWFSRTCQETSEAAQMLVSSANCFVNAQTKCLPTNMSLFRISWAFTRKWSGHTCNGGVWRSTKSLRQITQIYPVEYDSLSQWNQKTQSYDIRICREQ